MNQESRLSHNIGQLHPFIAGLEKSLHSAIYYVLLICIHINMYLHLYKGMFRMSKYSQNTPSFHPYRNFAWSNNCGFVIYISHIFYSNNTIYAFLCQILAQTCNIICSNILSLHKPLLS